MCPRTARAEQDKVLLLRSMLFVPGDDERKLERARSVPADALILDLEDSVSPSRKDLARNKVSRFLSDNSDRTVWVRINPLSSEHADIDLECIGSYPPSGIVLPKSTPTDVEQLGARLDHYESSLGLRRDSIKVISITTESPASIFSLGGYVSGPNERLHGLSWGAEDLSSMVGARTSTDERGNWLFAFELARSLCLFAAHAAGVAAIDTIHRDIRDMNGLRLHVERARRDGFAAVLAIHPNQVEVINNGLKPTTEEISYARRVVGAFNRAPETGVVALDDKMLDMPHLRQARHVLALAERFE